MRRQLIIILLLIMLNHVPQAVFSQGDVCISPVGETICYDPGVSFEKDEVLTWLITEATYNDTWVHVQGSFVDTWKLEAKFLQNFAPAIFNDPQTHFYAEDVGYKSIYNFNFVNASGDRTEVRFFDPIMLFNSTELDLTWFFYVSRRVPTELFANVGPADIITQDPPYEFITPTLYKNINVEENRFERDIREIPEWYSINHTILGNNYHAFDTNLIFSPFPINETLDLSSNIHSGILQKLRWTYTIGENNNHWETLVISLEFYDPVISAITLNDFSLPKILLVVTLILIIIIIAIYRRLDRT